MNILAKVIIVEYVNSISIYDSYKKIKADSELREHVLSNMKLKNGKSSLETGLCSDGETVYPVTIYSVNRFNYKFLKDIVKVNYEHFKSTFNKSCFDLDNFSAYSFRKYSE